MIIYMIFYILIFTPFIFFSLTNIFEFKEINRSYLFYFLSLLILGYSLPLFFFYFENYIIATLISLLLLGLLTITSYKFYKKSEFSLLYTLPALHFTYYTFCYILAINLTHL